MRPSLDVRFAAFARLAAGERRIGFIAVAGDGDDAGAMATRRVELQYALAPAVLGRGVEGGRLVAAWADRPDRLDALASEHRLKALHRTPDGYALFERTSP